MVSINPVQYCECIFLLIFLVFSLPLLIHVIYKIYIDQLCYLPVNSRLLVFKGLGSQELHMDFQLYREGSVLIVSELFKGQQ